MRHLNTLREHRETRGLTQWDVAKAVDIHLNRYGRMEKGVTPPSYQEGVRLGAFFGLEPGALFPQQAASSPAA